MHTMKLKLLSIFLLVPTMLMACSKQGDNTQSATPSTQEPPREPADHSVTILLAGDSTCCTWPETSAPKEGWGQNLADVLQDDAKVVNLAASGHSTRSFIETERWSQLCAQIKEKDIVCIQFGHNDKNSSVEERRIDVPGYKVNLARMVADVREKKGVPVLITSITLRKFANGSPRVSLSDYTNAMREVATEEKVQLIDINIQMLTWLSRLGEGGSIPYYMSDDTHLTHDGAYAVAEMVAAGLVKLGLW